MHCEEGVMAIMKLATFVPSMQGSSDNAVGVVVDEYIVHVKRLMEATGADQFEAYESMLELLEAGEDALMTIRNAIEELSQQRGWQDMTTPSGERIVFPLEHVRLLPPVPNARKLFCLAGNYEEHIREGGRDVLDKDRAIPRIFMKPPSTTLIGNRMPIAISRFAQHVDWEAELCVVMGKRGKYIPLDDALNYVAGYTIINDVSERRLKIRERAQTEEWDRFFDWLNGKWMDTFAPCGPWITTVDEIPDPQQLRIRLWVNGELQQDGNTRDMIFTVADIVHYLSHISTLEPGDLIATGTPSGVGVARGLQLKPGDVVTIEIDKIGRLENPVMSE